MRYRFALAAVLAFRACVAAQEHQPGIPNQFEIGRHTFFDFGPPNDFYELFLVRPAGKGSSIERITLTPAADECFQPAKVEVANGSLDLPIGALLGNSNPCTIPEKELRRERKRCKHCLVFSGANVAMQVQCGNQSRIIRADIHDKDMFDPAPKTPQHTSWTMQLLNRLDQAVGPNVMDRPIFPIPAEPGETSAPHDSAVLVEVGSGKYDSLFPGAPDKPSDLYRAAQVAPPAPTVRLVSSSPFEPIVSVQPSYPPLARLAHVEGSVKFALDVNPDGTVTSFTVENGHPLLRPATEKAVGAWKFPKEAAGQKVHAVVEFAMHCPKKER